ncbi:hypothetical protein DLAC_08415 [Tieghemostelium lacteum]|uniref:F-box domain-containing protein n=1 Tax=Tieghemostelium lacteum TaxID=361077 RepID=A0A151ZBY1_TIELA|nr:hypothetical protein DLAC_08415 [Tieghemostelium lacteum]|eukprot:KYQ91448.1 hypothetical protein DLAC_08415 [Tieghemostelium lacteum]
MNNNSIEFPKILFIKIFEYLQYNYESIDINKYKIYKLIRVLNRDYRDNIAPKFKYKYIVRDKKELESLLSIDISDLSMVDLTIYMSNDFKELYKRNQHVLQPLIKQYHSSLAQGIQNDFRKSTSLHFVRTHYQSTIPFLYPKDTIDTLHITFSKIADLVVIYKILKYYKILNSLKLGSLLNLVWIDVNGLQCISKLPNLTFLHLHSSHVIESELIYLISNSHTITSMVLENIGLNNEDSEPVSTVDSLFDTLSTSKYLTDFTFHNQMKGVPMVKLSFRSLVNMLNTNSILKRLTISFFSMPFEENLYICNNTLEYLTTNLISMETPTSRFARATFEFYWNVPSNLKRLNYFEQGLLDEFGNRYNHFQLQTLNYALEAPKYKKWAYLRQLLEFTKNSLQNLRLLCNTSLRIEYDYPKLFKIISNYRSIVNLELFIDVPSEDALNLIQMNIPNIKTLYLKVKSHNTTFLNSLGDVLKFNNSIENLQICDNEQYKPVFEFIQSLIPLINHQSLTSLTIIAVYNLSSHTVSEIDQLYDEFEKNLKLNLHHLKKLKLIDVPESSLHPQYQKFVTLLNKLFLNNP